jgi:uncharacterized protein with HEPN domain
MSKLSDIAKLELILKYIADVQRIIARHGSIDKTIEDYEGEYAVMMCLTQIAETVNKISNSEFLDSIDYRGIIAFRNRMVHNYEGRDKVIIAQILNTNLPILKDSIQSILG